MPRTHARTVATLAGLFVCTLTAAAKDGPTIGEGYQYRPGLNRTMLFIQDNQLTRLAGDGVTVQRTRKLPGDYTHLAEREDHFVALSAEPKSVVVLDKKTLRPIRSKRLQYLELTDLALNPRRPVCYVAVKFAIEAPRYRVIVFNETTGDAHEPRLFFGTWVRVHPAGTFLVTGHRDIYQRGTRFFINPGWQLHTVPDYGSIDLLISYALDDAGMPSFIDLKTKAGGNGKGLRMSPDGERVTYLSHVGTPQFSRNLGGFDPLDLQKLPVVYQTKDRATTYDLAYHPVLPLCASPGGGAAVFFHRETGELEPDRLADTVQFDKVHRVYFSPDGKHIVFDSELGGIRALRNAPLHLSAEEAATVARPLAHGTADNAADVQAAMARARREIEQKVDPTAAARDKAVDWLKLNNAFGPRHKIVSDQTGAIDEAVDAERNFYMTFGAGLVKSGTPTFLCIWNGEFFAFPLTREQAQGFNFPRFSVAKQTAGKSGWRLIEQRAQLHDLAINNADAVDGRAKLTGQVKLRRLDREQGNYALKVQYVVDNATITGYHHLGRFLRDGATIEFTFPPMLDAGRQHRGPLPVFIELVTFATAQRRTEAAIASNTVGQVVVLK